MRITHFHSVAALCLAIWGNNPCGQSIPLDEATLLKVLDERSVPDTIILEESEHEGEIYYMEYGILQMPLNVPEMTDGEITSVVCNDPETQNNWTVLYEDLLSTSLADYAAVLREEGYDTADIFTDAEGKHLNAQYNAISVSVIYNDGSATITIEREVD